MYLLFILVIAIHPTIYDVVRLILYIAVDIFMAYIKNIIIWKMERVT